MGRRPEWKVENENENGDHEYWHSYQEEEKVWQMKVESYILFSDVEFLAYLYAKRSMPIRKEKDKDDALKLNENT